MCTSHADDPPVFWGPMTKRRKGGGHAGLFIKEVVSQVRIVPAPRGWAEGGGFCMKRESIRNFLAMKSTTQHHLYE